MANPNFFSGAHNFSIGNMQVTNTARDHYSYTNNNIRNLYRQGDTVYNNYVNSNNVYENTHNGDIYTNPEFHNHTINNVKHVDNAMFGDNYADVNQYAGGRPSPGPGYRPGPPPPHRPSPSGGPPYRGPPSGRPPYGSSPYGASPPPRQPYSPYGAPPSGPHSSSGPYAPEAGAPYRAASPPQGPGLRPRPQPEFTNSSPEVPRFQTNATAQQMTEGPPPGERPFPMNQTHSSPGRPQPTETWNHQAGGPPSAFPPPNAGAPQPAAGAEGSSAANARGPQKEATPMDVDDEDSDDDDDIIGLGRPNGSQGLRSPGVGRQESTGWLHNPILSDSNLPAGAGGPSSSTAPNGGLASAHASSSTQQPQQHPTARPVSSFMTTDQQRKSWVPPHKASASIDNTAPRVPRPTVEDEDTSDEESDLELFEKHGPASLSPAQPDKKKKKKRGLLKKFGFGGKK